MNAREFLKRRARIEHERTRPNWWHRRALAHLIREAGAVPVVGGTRVVAYRLASGEIVCTKQRFKDEDLATKTLQMIHDEHQPRDREPVRAYACGHCKGWHITSMA